MIVLTLSGLVFIIFQGSSSAKYLLPNLAIFINSLHASLNLKFLMRFSIFFVLLSISLRIELSFGLSFEGFGIVES